MGCCLQCLPYLEIRIEFPDLMAELQFICLSIPWKRRKHTWEHERSRYHIEKNMQTIILFNHSPLVGYSVCFQALQRIRRQQKYRVYFIAEFFYFFFLMQQKDTILFMVCFYSVFWVFHTFKPLAHFTTCSFCN